MDGDYASCSIILLIIIILILAVFHGMEAALSESEVAKRVQEGEKQAKRLQKTLERAKALSASAHALTLILCMVAGGCIVPSCADFLCRRLFGAEAAFWPEGIACILIVGVLVVFLILLFGMLIPRQNGINHPERYVRSYAALAQGIGAVVYPLAAVADALARLVVRASGSVYHTEDENVTEEEIISMVIEGHEQGLLEESEAEMIHNIFEFDDKDAGDIMTHRTEIHALDVSMTLADAVKRMLEESNSRYPVYRGTIDDIIGILHLKDAMKAYQHMEFRHCPLSAVDGLLREVRFIPQSRNVSGLFRKMQQDSIYMVIVIDEYGQTAGLITMEDILEEIVGNIQDEYDPDEEEIREIDPQHFLIKGSTALEDVSERLEIDFDDDTHDTINGFMTARLGRIPAEGEEPEIVYGGYVFHALKIENKVICSIRAQRLTEEARISEENEKEEGE